MLHAEFISVLINTCYFSCTGIRRALRVPFARTSAATQHRSLLARAINTRVTFVEDSKNSTSIMITRILLELKRSSARARRVVASHEHVRIRRAPVRRSHVERMSLMNLRGGKRTHTFAATTRRSLSRRRDAWQGVRRSKLALARANNIIKHVHWIYRVQDGNATNAVPGTLSARRRSPLTGLDQWSGSEMHANAGCTALMHSISTALPHVVSAASVKVGTCAHRMH
jgi:hypothetical protein